MARVEGFEPPNASTKNWCLTTWRHPSIAALNVPKYYTVIEVIAQASNTVRSYCFLAFTPLERSTWANSL